MNGFVKLRRGLAEHVGSGRMTLTEHGAYTLLLQLVDHTSGCWRGTQRSFAEAAGISSGAAWKLLTSLERKGYLSWNRRKQAVQISKFFVEKSAEKPVEKPVENTNRPSGPGHPVDRNGHADDRPIRNTRTPLEKRDIAPLAWTASAAPSTRATETPEPDRAVLVAVLAAMREVAFAKSMGNRMASHSSARSRGSAGPGGMRRTDDRSPP